MDASVAPALPSSRGLMNFPGRAAVSEHSRSRARRFGCDSEFAITSRMSCQFDPARLLLEARRLSGLSQRELARRARTSQSVVACIERGTSSPSGKTLMRLLRAAGFEVRSELVPRPIADSHMLEDVARILALSPEQRLLEVRNLSRLEATVRRA